MIFNNICIGGDVKIVKWLLRVRPSIYNCNRIVFTMIVCYRNHLSLAKFLLQYDPNNINMIYGIKGIKSQLMINWIMQVNPLIEI